jgi:hypothetical protein
MAQNNDFTKMTITQLKDVLRGLQKAGHKVTLAGNKGELIAKINQAYGQGKHEVPENVVGAAPPVENVIEVPPLKVNSPKKEKVVKDPRANLMLAMRDANQTFGAAFELLLQVYGMGPVPEAENLAEVVIEAWETTPVALEAPTTYDELMKLRLVDLKKILKDRKQKVGGKKEELVNRILNPEAEVEAPAGGLELPPLEPVNVPIDVPEVENPNDLLTTELPAVPAFPDATALPTIPGVPGAFPTLPEVPGALPTLPEFPGAFPTLPEFPGAPEVIPSP